jgi:hypothetical protein
VIAAGRLAAAFASLLFPRPPAAGPLAVSSPATLDEAIATVLAPAPTAPPTLTSTPGPLVLGVGELHQTAGTAGIASSLSRFTHNVWPLIAARVSDLIVETWVTDGACGKAEAATVGDVARTTERPAATENEIVALLTRAKASGARPHILKVSCDEYQLLAPSGGGGARQPVDFERMLALIERKLEAKVTDVLATRPAADADKLIVVYGGALHNDLHPDPVLAPFSYGLRVFHATAGRYRELDLYVPEYLERNAAMHGEPWYAAWERAAAPGRPVLIRRSPASFIVVFANDKE